MLASYASAQFAIDGLSRAAPFLLISLLSLLASVALRGSQRPAAGFVRELLLLFALVLVYFVARGLAASRPVEALEHADQIIKIEQRLGIFHELEVQRSVLGFDAAIDFANWVYIWGHWPVVIAVIVWLGLRCPDRLPRYRNAMILSGAIGIALFLIYPVAPPRFFASLGFVDTIALRSRAYRVLQPPALTDLFASMPSLHFGWDLLMGIALVRESSAPAVRLLGVVLPAAMLFAIIVTANHYFLDAVAGGALVVAAYRATAATGLAPSSAAPHNRCRPG